MAEIAIRSLSKMYPGGVEAIRGIDLDIAGGELCVLVGPSGCGKSTLLRMIAGLETVSAGEIRVGGRVVNDLEPVERDMAMVFQNYALYPHMSVFDNMAYGLRNRGTPKPEIRRMVDEAARILGLEHLLTRRPRELSGGQRQRVAMGRAIVRQPQVFLFDEPLSNLDAKLRVKTRVEIRDLQQRLATTSIYVTHDQLEAMTLADRLVVMNAGRIEQIGPPLEVYERPASAFVAGFIGSPPMNFLSGHAGGGRVRLEGGGEIGTDHAADGPVTVGLRPEALRLVPDGVIEARLRVVERLGASATLHGVIESTGEEILASLATSSIPAPGETIRLDPQPRALHLFDRQTGLRLETARDPA
jgi:sn-glycerol 3-phosphate transport system ATP-binding protein